MDCCLFAAESFGAGLVVFIFVLQCILVFFLFDVFVPSRSGCGVFRLLLVVFCFVLSFFGVFKLVVSGISLLVWLFLQSSRCICLSRFGAFLVSWTECFIIYLPIKKNTFI